MHIKDMTLDDCLRFRDMEERKLDKMLKQQPLPGIKLFLEQEAKLDSLDYWIDRKRRIEKLREEAAE